MNINTRLGHAVTIIHYLLHLPHKQYSYVFFLSVAMQKNITFLRYINRLELVM